MGRRLGRAAHTAGPRAFLAQRLPRALHRAQLRLLLKQLQLCLHKLGRVGDAGLDGAGEAAGDDRLAQVALAAATAAHCAHHGARGSEEACRRACTALPPVYRTHWARMPRPSPPPPSRPTPATPQPWTLTAPPLPPSPPPQPPQSPPSQFTPTPPQKPLNHSTLQPQHNEVCRRRHCRRHRCECAEPAARCQRAHPKGCIGNSASRPSPFPPASLTTAGSPRSALSRRWRWRARIGRNRGLWPRKSALTV